MRARVVGAGISGLATAWYLADAGWEVEVLEAADRPGGLIQTVHTELGPAETAASAVMYAGPVAALFGAIGLVPTFELAESKRRYLFRNGRASRLPLSPLEVMATAGRFAGAWLGRAVKPRQGESVQAWGRRVVGRAATEWLLTPVFHGIYGVPPESLSAEAVMRRRSRGKLASAPHGMGDLVTRLHERLAARGVTFRFGERVDALEPGVPTAVCVNAPAAARLVAPHAPALGEAIGRIRMAALTPATAFFEPDPQDLRGFGVLFPRSAGVTALGVRFNSDTFPGRGPLRSETWIFAGASASDDEIAARIRSDRRVLTGGRDAEPRGIHITRWAQAIPVYDQAVVAANAAAQAPLPSWLALSGNYLGRIGAADLIVAAKDAAARLAGQSQITNHKSQMTSRT